MRGAIHSGNDTNGRRRVAKPGIASHPTWRLVLPVGNYFWRVQSVDAAFAGSPFSVESNFSVPVQAPRSLTFGAGTNTAGYPVLNGSVNPNGAGTVAWFEYGLTTSYGGASPSTNAGNGGSAEIGRASCRERV